MRLKEQPIAPAIGTGKNRTSKQCNFEILFFSFFPKILANRNVSHIFLSLSFEYDRSFAGKSPGIACQAQNPCESDTAPLLLEPTGQPVRGDVPYTGPIR